MAVRHAAPGAAAFGCAIMAHGLVVAALIISYGHNHPVADLLAVAAAPAACAGWWATRWPGRHEAGAPAIAWAAALASAIAVAVVDPGTFVGPTAPMVPLRVMSLAAVGVVASYAFDLLGARGVADPALRWLAHARPSLLIALGLGLGAWMLSASPAPAIDVWTVHQQGADALVHGHPVYAPGAIATVDTHSHERQIDSYAYPPLNLLLTAAAYAVTGETRWAQLVAILVGAALLRATAQRKGLPHPVPDLLMACLVFHPRGLFVLEQAWGEPLALPLLGGFTLAWAGGRPRLAAGMLGLLCALKQHYVLYLPALALLPGVGASGVAIALATLLATYAPFAVSAPQGVYRAVVEHHLKNPFRADSLSLTARLSDAGVFLPSWLGFAASVASLVALAWTPRRLGPLLLASSLTFAVFYLLGRQAFCNYYYLLGATWLFAAGSLADAGCSR
jgi:hypothetical protein